MKDYAKIGWRRRRGLGHQLADDWLNGVWLLVASPTTSLALLLLLAGVLLLDSTSAGSLLPVEDLSRFGPIGGRVILVLLATNLVALGLNRALPFLLPRAAKPNELRLPGGLSKNLAIPFVRRNPKLEDIVERAGFAAAVPAGRRRAFGASNALPVVGAILAAAGAMILSVGLIAGLDDPSAGRLKLVEGQPVEVVSHDQGDTNVDEFLGYQFEIQNSFGLLSLLDPTIPSSGDSLLLITNLVDNSSHQMKLTPTGKIALGDGVLHLASIVQGNTPSAATVRVKGANGELGAPQVLGIGAPLVVGNETLRVTNISLDHLNSMGPAVELTGEGAPQLVLMNLPKLQDVSPSDVELVSVERGYEITLEYARTQNQLMPLLGMAFLILGGLLLLSGAQLSVEVDDEVDRVVMKGTSVNAMEPVYAALDDLAKEIATAYEGFGDGDEDVSSEPLAAATKDSDEEDSDEEDSDEDDSDEEDSNEDDSDEEDSNEEDSDEDDSDEEDSDEDDSDEDDSDEEDSDEDDSDEEKNGNKGEEGGR